MRSNSKQCELTPKYNNHFFSGVNFTSYEKNCHGTEARTKFAILHFKKELAVCDLNKNFKSKCQKFIKATSIAQTKKLFKTLII